MSYNKQSHLRQRLLKICEESHSYGINIAQIIPPEMRGNFQDLQELHDAKTYIKECEEREKGLRSENDHLAKQLAVAKQAVKDVPADHKQLEVDYNQAQHMIQFWKGLHDNAEIRAENYRQKWKDASQKQLASEESQQRILVLEKELTSQKSIIQKLIDENHTVQDLFDAFRENGGKKLEQKESELVEMSNYLSLQEERYKDIEQENDALEQTYNDLLERLQDETEESAAALNRKTQIMRLNEQHICASISEIKILRQYYERCYLVLVIYQRIFEQILNPEKPQPRWVSDTLDPLILSAKKEVEAFKEVSDTFNAEGVEVDELRAELAGLAHLMHKLQMWLERIAEDLDKFFMEPKQKADLWGSMCNKLGRLSPRSSPLSPLSPLSPSRIS
ncbi:hypothetical protein CC78DRAFT_543524 [Lojkania enalia]|uniref:Uncharacterized protein n=1 Tax=Lojkania enalia TaxID=147567 RepID=A0A9P4N8K2_9PLEO|nr:hypothetical protein CC78DRAFT_543524 [Didymosphaeria enalia]